MGSQPQAKLPFDLNKAWSLWGWGAGVLELTGQDSGAPERAGLTRTRTKAAIPCSCSMRQAPRGPACCLEVATAGAWS